MKKNFTFVLFFIIFIILIFLNKDLVTESAVNSITLFQNKVFPSLFIMFIIQDLIINYNGAIFFNILLNNLFKKLFKISSSGQMAFTLSLFSGSPSNAFILNELVENKQISTKEANHILKFSYFANPLFLYTMLSLTFEIFITFKIITSLYLSNFILAFCLRKETFKSNEVFKIHNNNFGFILTNAIKKSINTLIMILGSISFFMIFSSLISIFIHNNFFFTICSGLFEITAGLNNLITLETTIFIKKIIATFIISFGGLSIHSQIFSIISTTNLSYKSFLKGRILASLLAVLIVIVI